MLLLKLAQGDAKQISGLLPAADRLNVQTALLVPPRFQVHGQLTSAEDAVLDFLWKVLAP